MPDSLLAHDLKKVSLLFSLFCPIKLTNISPACMRMKYEEQEPITGLHTWWVSLLFSLHLGGIRWLSGSLWVKRERCHSQSAVIENIHEHCIGSQNERAIYAASHHCAGTPAPNAFLWFLLGTTTIWAGVEACCPLNPLPPCKAKSRHFACACALSALPMLLFHQANHCESVSTSWLLCCSLGMTVHAHLWALHVLSVWCSMLVRLPKPPSLRRISPLLECFLLNSP